MIKNIDKNHLQDNPMHYKKLLSRNYGIPFDDTHHINTLVIGELGVGKTQLFEVPNILYTDVSFVCMDTFFGEMYKQTERELKEKKYKVFKIDLNNDANTDGIDIFKMENVSTFLADYYYPDESFYNGVFNYMLQVGLYLTNQEYKNPLVENLKECFLNDKTEEMLKKYPSVEALNKWKHIKKCIPEGLIKDTFKAESNCYLNEIAEYNNAFTRGNINLEDFNNGKCALFIIPKRDGNQSNELMLNLIVDELMDIVERNYKPYEIPIHIIHDCFAVNTKSDLFLKDMAFMNGMYNMNVSLVVQTMEQFEAFIKKCNVHGIKENIGTILMLTKDGRAITTQGKTCIVDYKFNFAD